MLSANAPRDARSPACRQFFESVRGDSRDNELTPFARIDVVNDFSWHRTLLGPNALVSCRCPKDKTGPHTIKMTEKNEMR